MSSTRPRLREARAYAGLTQTELAALIGVKQPHVAVIESGGRTPKVDTALRIAQALGRTVEEIWGDPITTPGGSKP